MFNITKNYLKLNAINNMMNPKMQPKFLGKILNSKTSSP